jgi:HEAT repeat protein
MNCDTIIPFLRELIISDPNEEVRCDALLLLGWRHPHNEIPFLVEYAKKDISSTEKIAVAAVLSVLEAYPQALEILDKYCMETEEINEKCIWAYYSAGNNSSSLRFFDYYFDKPKYRVFAALKLAELGVYDKTYPVFVNALRSESQSVVHMAIFGLAAVGTEEAFQLLRDQTRSKDEFIARDAQFIFDYIEKHKEDKKNSKIEHVRP